MFYRAANLPIEKVCIIKNFEEANFSGFKLLVVHLKINPQRYNWPQKTCRTPQQYIPGLNWSVIVMQIDRAKFMIRHHRRL